MKTFLEKLEHKAENWLGVVDDQLQQPILQVMTGEVFIHNPNLSGIDNPGQPAQPTIPPPSSGLHQPAETYDREIQCQPVLRKANA
jgi:hypothetical protein